MNTQDNGGPAFPQTVTLGNASIAEGGMTLRDYYIAHAPAEPQQWFEPVMATERPKHKWTFEECCKTGPFFDSMREAEKHFNTCDEFIVNVSSADQSDWQAERLKQRYLQWPAA